MLESTPTAGKGYYRLPVTAGQSGVWFGQHLDPSSPAYNIGLHVDIEGPVDAALLEVAVRRCLGECDGQRARVGSRTAGCGSGWSRWAPAEVGGGRVW